MESVEQRARARQSRDRVRARAVDQGYDGAQSEYRPGRFESEQCPDEQGDAQAQAEQAAERRGEDRDGGVAIERKARELRDQRDGLGGDQQYHAYDREPSQSWLTS